MSSTSYSPLSLLLFLLEHRPLQQDLRLKGRTQRALGPELLHALQPASMVSGSVFQHLPACSAHSTPPALLAISGPGEYRWPYLHSVVGSVSGDTWYRSRKQMNLRRPCLQLLLAGVEPLPYRHAMHIPCA